MPSFCSCGGDEFICQKCHKIFCSDPSCSHGTTYHWSPEITGNEQAGAVCDQCFAHLINTLKEFVRIRGLFNAKYYTMNFGKHKGLKVPDVPESYYRWALKETGFKPENPRGSRFAFETNIGHRANEDAEPD